MTQAEEMKALKKFTDSMPHESYLRPALEELIPQIEHDMASDILPDLIGTRGEMQRQIDVAKDRLKELNLEIFRASEKLKLAMDRQKNCEAAICEAKQIARRIVES